MASELISIVKYGVKGFLEQLFIFDIFIRIKLKYLIYWFIRYEQIWKGSLICQTFSGTSLTTRCKTIFYIKKTLNIVEIVKQLLELEKKSKSFLNKWTCANSSAIIPLSRGIIVTTCTFIPSRSNPLNYNENRIRIHYGLYGVSG